MYNDFFLAGFGGQGVLVVGNLIAEAAMRAGRRVTFMPSYGVEMRGGTANCTVVVSDHEIGSPIITHPRNCIPCLLAKAGFDAWLSAVIPLTK